MKYVIVLLIVGVLGVSTVEASKKLIKGESFASVGISPDQVTVYRVIDGDTVCYVTRHDKFGAHAISCVK